MKTTTKKSVIPVKVCANKIILYQLLHTNSHSSVRQRKSKCETMKMIRMLKFEYKTEVTMLFNNSYCLYEIHIVDAEGRNVERE